MLSANEITEILRANKAQELAKAYLEITGKPLDFKCGSCLQDARKVIGVHLKQLIEQSAPLHLYLVNPSKETLYQISQGGGHYDKIEVCDTFEYAQSQLSKDAVNIISNDAFFDHTILEAKKIKLYERYELECFTWNGNGHATLKQGEVRCWIQRGNKQGFQVSNPFDEIHCICLSE